MGRRRQARASSAAKSGPEQRLLIHNQPNRPTCPLQVSSGRQRIRSAASEALGGSGAAKQCRPLRPLNSVTTIDRSRWEQLYRRAFPDVYRAVLGVVLDPNLALDAVHDAFEVGLRNPPADDTNLAGWLFRVAVRRALRIRLRRPR